jgi:branched-chain amino acid transport system substrate-binding protein
MPKEIAGQKVNYIVLDDASDTTTRGQEHPQADHREQGRHRHRLDHTPNSLAMIDVVPKPGADDLHGGLGADRRAGGRQEALGVQDAAERHHDGAGDRRAHDQQQRQDGRLHRLCRRLRRRLVPEFSKIAEQANPASSANERFNRTDTSVTGQVLKMISAKPDAVLIGGAGTPAALPQKSLKERGYKGKYQTHGVANADFLRVGGKDLRRHLPARRAGAGGRTAARQQPGQESGAGICRPSTRRRMARAASRPSVRTPGTPASC